MALNMIATLTFAQVGAGIFLTWSTKQDFIAQGYNINYSSFDLTPDSMHDTLLTFHMGCSN